MKWCLFLMPVLIVVTGCAGAEPAPTPMETGEVNVQLPEVRLSSEVSLEEALLQRRSIRDYSGQALTLEEVSQLLWACQGTTADWGGRTAPSAGALYPLEVYLAAGRVDNLDTGVYKYRPHAHDLVKVRDGDVRAELARASLGQSPVRDGAADIVIAAVYERTTGKYGDRGIRYVHMEAGHAAQNVYLQATALDLGTVTIGAFFDDEVREVVGMPGNEEPLYVIPVGRKT